MNRRSKQNKNFVSLKHLTPRINYEKELFF